MYILQITGIRHSDSQCLRLYCIYSYYKILAYDSVEVLIYPFVAYFMYNSLGPLIPYPTLKQSKINEPN